jgi:thiolase-like protein
LEQAERFGEGDGSAAIIHTELAIDIVERRYVILLALSLPQVLDLSISVRCFTMMYELRRQHLKYGAASLCIGGGQGIAAIIESVG